MRIREKIDFKKYTILSLILLASSFFMAENTEELKAMTAVFLAACLNQWMLVEGVLKLTSAVAKKERPDKGILSLLFVGKTIVLVATLTFGVQIMGKRIIIPLLIYVLQIMVLYLSFKKTNMDETEQET